MHQRRRGTDGVPDRMYPIDYASRAAVPGRGAGLGTGPARRGRVVALVVGSLQPIAHAVGAAGSTLIGARRVTAGTECLHIEVRALDQNTLSSRFPSTFGKNWTPTHRAIRGRPAPGRRHCSDHVGVAIGVDRRCSMASSCGVGWLFRRYTEFPVPKPLS
jgi:hypothetical protein